MNFTTGQYWNSGQSVAVTVARNSVDSCSTVGGTVLYATANNPCITDAGIQSWIAATNLLLQSTFAASWTATRSTLTANAVTSPDATTNAATLVEDATATNTHLVSQNVTKAASAISYFYSVYAKAGTRTRIALQFDDNAGNGAVAGYDLSGQQIGYTVAGVGTPFTTLTAFITCWPTGWCRCSISGTSNTATTIRGAAMLDSGSGTAAQSTTYSGDGTSGASIFGAQLEALSTTTGTPSPYIPTTTIAVARAATYVTMTYPPLFGAQYSLWSQAKTITPTTYATNQTTLTTFLTDDTNRVSMRRVSATGALLATGAGGNAFNITPTGTWAQNVSAKFAVAVAPASQAASFAGNTPGTATSAAIASTPTGVAIGSTGVVGNNWGGQIERIAIWPNTRLQNSQLQDLTR